MQVPKFISQCLGIFCTLSLLNASMNGFMGISYMFLAYMWGTCCMIVFLDSVVLVNDLKMLQCKFDDLKEKYIMLEAFRKQEKQGSETRENDFLRSLSIQSTQLQNDMCSLSESLDSMSMKLDDSPESQYSNGNLKKIPELKQNSPLLKCHHKKDWQSSHHFSVSNPTFKSIEIKTGTGLHCSKSENFTEQLRQRGQEQSLGTFSFQIGFSENNQLKKAKSSPDLSAL